MSKINVKIIAGDCEGIDVSEIKQEMFFHNFTFKYGSLTKIKKLLLAVCEKCNVEISQDYSLKFQLLHGDDLYFLNPNVRLKNLLKYLCVRKQITFVYLFGGPGGKTLDDTNGVRYFLHTKETNHTPHIHAEYSGEEISVYLLTGKIKGSFKSNKKMKQVKKYVNDNKETLIDAYTKYSNGIVTFY